MQPQIRLLGGHTLVAPDGAPVRLPTRKSWALLGYLVQSGGSAVPREELATLLWAQSGDDQARASLRQELAVVKKALTAARIDAFEADKDAVRFALPAGLADTTQLAAGLASARPGQMRAAAALYRGEFLAGLVVRSEPFEEWLWLERQRLRNDVTGALIALLRTDAEEGATDQVAETARAVLAVDATQEAAHRALMRLYHQTGRRPEALQQYDHCRAALRRDLDTTPSRKTQDLADRIRSGGGEAAADAAPAPEDEAPAQRVEAAVLSVGLSGAAALGPEAAPDLLAAENAIAARTAEATAAHGGIAVRRDAGRVTAVFPATGGDPAGAAHRAARTALSLVAAPVAFGAAPGLLPRAGLSCGALSMAGAGEAAAAGASGVPLHAAAALEQAAAPGEILVDGAFRGLVGAVYDCRDLPGPARPRDAPRGALAILGQEKIAAARTARSAPPLTGRAAELAALRELWRRVRGGERATALIEGPAGIGKARLVEGFLETALADDPSVVQLRCASATRNSAFAPLADWLRHDMRLPRDAGPGDARRRIEGWAAGLGPVPASASAAVLDLLAPDGADADAAAPRTEDAGLAALLSARARGQPQIVAVTDLDWADGRTAALLEALADDPGAPPRLILATLRAGPGPGWLAGGAALRLGPLGSKDAAALAAAILPPDAAPQAAAAIAAQAGGVPLIVEETAVSARDAMLSAPGGGGAAAPETLQAAIAARIDTLSASARDVLQIAAVFGATVPFEDLRAVTGLPGGALDARLRQLAEAGLLFPAARAPVRQHDFRHVLVQELIYSTLPPTRRTACHQRIAEVLEARGGVGAAAMPERIARHYDRAGRPRKALPFLEAAGLRAARLAAPAEAANHYRAALRLANGLADPEDRARTELRLLLALGPQVQAARGFAADEVGEIYDRARAIALEAGGGAALDRLEPVLIGLWANYITRADLSAAIGVAAEFLAEAQAGGDPVSQCAGQHMLGVGRFYRGHLTAAQEYFDRSRERYAHCPAGALIGRYGVDLGIAALGFEAWTAVLTGRLADGVRAGQGAIEAAEASGHRLTLVLARVFAAGAHAFAGRPAASLPLAEAAEAAARGPGHEQWRAQARMQIGRALWAMGRGGGAEMLEGALRAYVASGAALAVPYARAWLAEACLDAGRIDAGLGHLDAAAAHVAATGEAYFDAELHRLRAELLLRRKGGHDAAEAAYAAAIEAADLSGAALLGLRARAGFARFLTARGRTEAALGVLDAGAPTRDAGDSADARRAAELREEILGRL